MSDLKDKVAKEVREQIARQVLAPVSQKQPEKQS